MSQEQLAALVKPPTTQPQIDRLEKGERGLTQEWMARIAAAFQIEPKDLLPDGSIPIAERTSVRIPLEKVASRNQGGVTFEPGGEARFREGPRDLPILGHVKAGQQGLGFFLDQGERQGWTMRPKPLIGVLNAFAVRVRDDSMFPAYEPDDLVYINPALPVIAPVNVIIELHDGQAFIKRLIRRTEKAVICLQWNPKEEVKYDPKLIKNIYRIYRPNDL